MPDKVIFRDRRGFVGGTYLAAVRRSAAVETPAGRLMSSKNRAAAREAKKEKPILLVCLSPVNCWIEFKMIRRGFRQQRTRGQRRNAM
jgi:hypothetical protein